MPMAQWPNVEVPLGKWVTPAGLCVQCSLQKFIFPASLQFLPYSSGSFSLTRMLFCLLSHKVRFTYKRKAEEGAVFGGGSVRGWCTSRHQAVGGGIEL